MNPLQDYNRALSRENNKYGIGWQMPSFLAAVLYPLFSKIDMMFRRAGAMRCNYIVLHQRNLQRWMEEEGESFSSGLLVFDDHSFWVVAWASEPCWICRQVCKDLCKSFSQHLQQIYLFNAVCQFFRHWQKIGEALLELGNLRETGFGRTAQVWNLCFEVNFNSSWVV